MLIDIENMAEYEYCVGRGLNPLLNPMFNVDINLRVEIQRALFGPIAEHEKFFRWVWEHKPHYCEECLAPLHNYSAVYCSHILTRGAHPEMAHDCRNINILCYTHHSMWEYGNRHSMRINAKNQQTIDKLTKEYLQINHE